MYNGIHINKYVKKWLTSDSKLLELVPRQNMAPLMISPTERPIITWAHGPIEPDYAKCPDGVVVDHVQVGILIVTNDYEQGVDICARVREILELQQYNDADIHIPLISILDISEDSVNDSYAQQITLDFEIESERD